MFHFFVIATVALIALISDRFDFDCFVHLDTIILSARPRRKGRQAVPPGRQANRSKLLINLGVTESPSVTVTFLCFASFCGFHLDLLCRLSTIRALLV